ncbi:PLP-dependent aminotransferase family protein [Trinickia terrae]|uniref:PLP-dependent aminotransferase family protein n=1 Tax=Trinickia terrae TaxID=2571161 RepID=A0A4U1IFK7_9BURK|nr:PLP-dependent aminotransferase family protein [Trinickia terrae]TKC92467.1 PLP-dependent aminotransferase family protein [Trinickia terrae]
MDYGLLVSTFTHRNQTRGLTQQRLLYECLRQAILEGRLAQGSRLASSRALAEELGMARNSVLYAYERLADEGFVAATRQGSEVARVGLVRPEPAPVAAGREVALARRVEGLYRESVAHGEQKPFRLGIPALDEFPLAQWRSSLERAWRTIGPQHLGYGNIEGHPALRHAIAEHLKVSRGVRCEIDQVFITDGTQSSLDHCARLFADPGEPVWLENPGYNGARAAFRSAGLTIVPIPVDADGIAPSAKDWRRAPPKLVYVTPSHQYPLGSVLSLERRLWLIEEARKTGAWIIEDDYDSEFRHDGPPLPAVQGLTADAPVIYLGTFSKTMFPSLRLGFMVVPAALTAAAAGPLGALARRGRLAEQIALADFIESGLYTRHLRRMRRLYAERRDALSDALRRHLGGMLTVSAGAGGMHLSAQLTAPIADVDVCAAARQAGLIVPPLSAYCLPCVDIARYNGLALGYAGVPSGNMDGLAQQLACILGSFKTNR